MDLLLVAQATTGLVELAAAEPALIFGLTVAEWSVLLTALAGFAAALKENLQRRRGTKKLAAVIEALEETAKAHPEATAVVKRSVRRKATQMGVEVSMWGLDGLEADVKKMTTRMKRLTPPDLDKLEEDENAADAGS